MHGRVDRAGEERRVDFLGEQALAAGLGEGAILDRVAARADDLKRDALDLPALGLSQAAAGLVRLDERQGRTARAKREQGGGWGHPSGLTFETNPVKLGPFRKSLRVAVRATQWPSVRCP